VLEAREAFQADLQGELLLYLQLALPAEIAGDEVARPGADAVGDVVAGDVEQLALVGDAADDHVRVRVPGIVVIDGDPIEGGVEVLLHLLHELPREGLEVAELDAILGGDDEPELVPVLPAAVDEVLGVGLVVGRRVGVPALPVQGDALALQVAQVGGDGLTLHPLQLDDACLDDDAPCPVAHDAARLGAGACFPAAVALKGGGRLPASPARIEPSRGLALPMGPKQSARIAAVLDVRSEDKVSSRERPLPVLAVRLSEARSQFGWLVLGHTIELGAELRKDKGA
jgi:hypothetical protein